MASNRSHVIESLKLLSSTKDSLHVKWHVAPENLPIIHGYTVHYYAEGSTVRQYTEELTTDTSDYDILQLHENTYYRICITVLSNVTVETDHACLRATTSVDSLSVALGSTFGAFLALGIIVFFVFLAKWQHTRKLKKHLRHVTPAGDRYDSMGQHDADLEMSDVSLQVNEGTVTHDALSSKSSQISEGTHLKDPYLEEEEPYINGNLEGAALDSLEDSDSEEEDYDSSPSGPLDNTYPPESPTPPPIDPPPYPGPKHGVRELQTDGYRSSSTPQNTPPSPTNAAHTSSSPSPTETNSLRRDYGGARPKEYSTMDARNSFPNAQLIDLPNSNPAALQAEANCKW